jgi:hypothetical protein
MMKISILTALMMHVAAAFSSAQEVIRSWSTDGFPFLGAGRVLSMNDIDNDGVRELLMGNPSVDVNGMADAGAFALYSGATGSVIYERYGDRPNFNLGDTMAVLGDVDGNGSEDIAVAAFRGNRTRVYSGPDGKLLFEHGSWTGEIERLGDLNGDGYADFSIGNQVGANPRVWVILGGSFSVHLALNVPPGYTNYPSGFGSDVASLGDIDGDGFGDFVVGEYWPTRHAIVPGRAHAYSGRDGTSLYTVILPNDGAEAIETMGDLNGNGTLDFAAGYGSHAIGFFEGSDGSLIDVIPTPPNSSEMGRSLYACRDLNGNGCRDLFSWSFDVGPFGYYYNLRLYDGITRELLLLKAHSERIQDVDNDWNGDGIPDYMRRSERVEVVSVAPPWADPKGEACSVVRGEELRIFAAGTPVAGGVVEITVTGMTPGRAALLLVGMPHVRSLRGRGPVGGCSPLFQPLEIFAARTEARCSTAGATIALRIPEDAGFVGGDILTQWLVSTGSPGVWSTTRALQLRLD